MQILGNRKLLYTNEGLSLKVLELLGSGSQGEVYLVEWRSSKFALKWYYKASANIEQFKQIKTLISMESPDFNFLWPLKLIESPTVDGFGYLMRLRDKSYLNLSHALSENIDLSFQEILVISRGISDCFLSLHSKGLCYRDISFGNIFFDPKTCKVLIADNDNISLENTPAQIFGTPDFMAPEIVRGESEPNITTDLYSLAVLLFYLFFMHHPLYGKRVMRIHCLDYPARLELCGEQPIFIFDPENKSNQALNFLQDPSGLAGGNAILFWKIYPDWFKDLFLRAFTDGLKYKKFRVRVSEWKVSITKLLEHLFHCQCEAENFYQRKSFQGEKFLQTCWSCSKLLQLPPRVKINEHIMMISNERLIYPFQIDANEIEFSNKPILKFEYCEDLWMTNLSNKRLTFIDGEVRQIINANHKKVKIEKSSIVEFENQYIYIKV